MRILGANAKFAKDIKRKLVVRDLGAKLQGSPASTQPLGQVAQKFSYSKFSKCSFHCSRHPYGLNKHLAEPVRTYRCTRDSS